MNEFQEKIMNQEELDYSSRATPSFIKFLELLNISLLVSSYDTHRVIAINAKNNQLNTFLHPVPRPRGLAVKENCISISSLFEVTHYYRDSTETGTFWPRSQHITGELNIHDIAWGEGGLWLVNTEFSCLATLSPELSFNPKWWPFFKTSKSKDSSCHLNGMAMQNGEPKFATCFGPFKENSNARFGNIQQSGLILNVEDNRIFAEGLWMPHSPTIHQDFLYVCNSGFGQVIRYSLDGEKAECVANLNGFTRAMAFTDDFVFVCVSKVRGSKAQTPSFDYQKGINNNAGIYIIDLNSFEVVAKLEFTGDVGQLYDIVILEDLPEFKFVSLSDSQIREHHAY